jgi:hypothetical protein
MRNQYDMGVTVSTFGDFSDTAAQAENLDPDYMRYEAAKASWRRQYTNASPSEYEEAIAAIARACGV